MLFILLLLPFIVIKTSKEVEFMGIMIILFFIINPIAAAIINSMIGTDVKKMWWLPLLFSIMFLLSYWLILEEIILDLTFYAVIYMIIGIISMITSCILKKKSKK